MGDLIGEPIIAAPALRAASLCDTSSNVLRRRCFARVTLAAASPTCICKRAYSCREPAHDPLTVKPTLRRPQPYKHTKQKNTTAGTPPRPHSHLPKHFLINLIRKFPIDTRKRLAPYTYILHFGIVRAVVMPLDSCCRSIYFYVLPSGDYFATFAGAGGVLCGTAPLLVRLVSLSAVDVASLCSHDASLCSYESSAT